MDHQFLHKIIAPLSLATKRCTNYNKHTMYIRFI
jgi:hypothetical protein